MNSQRIIKIASVNNQECRKRPEIININSNEPTFYPYSIKVNKCSGSCNCIVIVILLPTDWF